jgi:hypothetical protein
MTLEIRNCVVATGRFSAHAAADGNSTSIKILSIEPQSEPSNPRTPAAQPSHAMFHVTDGLEIPGMRGTEPPPLAVLPVLSSLRPGRPGRAS